MTTFVIHQKQFHKRMKKYIAFVGICCAIACTFHSPPTLAGNPKTTIDPQKEKQSIACAPVAIGMTCYQYEAGSIITDAPVLVTATGLSPANAEHEGYAYQVSVTSVSGSPGRQRLCLYDLRSCGSISYFNTSFKTPGSELHFSHIDPGLNS